MQADTVSPVNTSTDDGTGQSELLSSNPNPGSGIGTLLDGTGRKRDAKMIERAIRERWPMSHGKRRKIVQRLMRLVLYGGNGEAIAAASALIRCDAINVQAITPKPGRQSVTVNGNVQIGSGLPADQQAKVAEVARILSAAPADHPE